MENMVYERIKANFDRQNFLALIGAKLESAERGKVVISSNYRSDLTQQQGLLPFRHDAKGRSKK